MLTLKLITEETDRVIRGLEKKHFKGAKEAIDEVLAVDKRRREAQQKLDANLSEAKKLAAQIGALMKEGKREEADNIKESVAKMKDSNKQLEETMNEAQEEMTRLLCQIPNIPYDEVPEGATAEDNHVVKSNQKECDGTDTVGNWTANPVEIQPHRFRLGCKDYRCRIPRIYRQGCPPAACPHQFLPRRGSQERLYGNYASYSSECRFWIWHRSVAR